MYKYPGATTEESVRIKLDTYILNPNHRDGKDKARWFTAALGFDRSNMEDLASQIVFDPSQAVPRAVTPFGEKLRQPIAITGANGRQIKVVFAWIRNEDDVVRLVTAVPTKQQRRQYV